MTFEAKGTLESKFYGLLPVVFVSESKILNDGKVTGKVYSLHLTPFFSFGFVVPSFTLKVRNIFLTFA